MKKNIILTAMLAASATLANAAVTTSAGDRIDAYTSDDTFSSILVDDIRSISYKGNPLTGYTNICVTMADGSTLDLPISSLSQLIYRHVDATPYEIKVIDHEHASFRMLYNHNKPDDINPIDPTKPYGWRGGKAGDPVFFIPTPAKGYTCDYTITGAYSGKNYLDVLGFVSFVNANFTAQFGIGLDCLMYSMPFEPTVMTMNAIERTDYEGISVLGTYHGGRISSGTGHSRSGSSDELTYSLKANTTFEFQSNEPEPISLIDCFTYDEEKASVENVPDPDDQNVSPDYMKVKWGITGRFTPEGVLFLRASYLPDNTPEKARYYFASPTPSTFAIADGDEFGMRSILQINPENSDPLFYLIESYGYSYKKVDVEFITGNSVAETSEAYLSYDGSRQIKFINGEGSDPKMILKGIEAGNFTYSGTSSYPQLSLDGFGTATFGDKTCDYTYADGMLTLIMPEGNIELIINMSDMTYVEKTDEKWHGAKIFSTTKAIGSYQGEPESATSGITLCLDQDYNGAEKAGSATVKVTVARSDHYMPLEIVGSVGTYDYNAAERTITVTKIALFTWNGSEWEYGRFNLTFHISDDSKTVWLGTESIGDKLWGLKQDGSYIVAGEQCILYAEGIDGDGEGNNPADAITGTYSGQASGSYMGMMDLQSDVTLTVDEDKATIRIVAMNSDIINSTVDYEFAENLLTLKDVTVGNGDSFSGINILQDLQFTLTDNSFIASGEVYGTSSATCGIIIRLDEVVLSK